MFFTRRTHSQAAFSEDTFLISHGLNELKEKLNQGERVVKIRYSVAALSACYDSFTLTNRFDIEEILRALFISKARGDDEMGICEYYPNLEFELSGGERYNLGPELLTVENDDCLKRLLRWHVAKNPPRFVNYAGLLDLEDALQNGTPIMSAKGIQMDDQTSRTLFFLTDCDEISRLSRLLLSLEVDHERTRSIDPDLASKPSLLLRFRLADGSKSNVSFIGKRLSKNYIALKTNHPFWNEIETLTRKYNSSSLPSFFDVTDLDMLQVAIKEGDTIAEMTYHRFISDGIDTEYSLDERSFPLIMRYLSFIEIHSGPHPWHPANHSTRDYFTISLQSGYSCCIIFIDRKLVVLSARSSSQYILRFDKPFWQVLDQYTIGYDTRR